MTPSLRRVSALLWAPAMLGAFAWSCAAGSEVEPLVDVDPSLPVIDASWNPEPAHPDAGASDEDEAYGEEKPRANDGPDESPGVPESAPSPPTSPPPALPPAEPPKPVPGEVLVTEVMYDPSTSEPATEWFEVHNTTSEARSLSGLTIVDGANRTHDIGPGVVVPAGAWVVLARSTAAAIAAKVPDASIVYEYGAGLPDGTGILLANGKSGAVFLRDGDVVIAQADYGGWFSASGSSIQLHTLGFAASGQSTSWCVSTTPWAPEADRGTPGAPPDCP